MGFVLDQVAQGIADGPGAADVLPHALLAAEALQAAGMVGGQGVVVPADGAAELDAVGVDASGGVVGRRDASGGPVGEPAHVAEAGGHGSDAGTGLAFE